MASKKLLLPTLGVVGLVAGGVGAYVYFNQNQTRTEAPALTLARVVPQQAVTVGYISTDSKTWDQLKTFAIPVDESEIAQGLKSLEESVLAGTNLTIQQDLQPVVNGIMVATMPTNVSDNPSASQPNPTIPEDGDAEVSPPDPVGDVLVVAGIKDASGVEKLKAKLKSQSGAQIRDLDIQGVPVVEVTVKTGKEDVRETTYLAIANQHLLLTNLQRTMEQAIATTKGAPSLAQRDTASDLLEDDSFSQHSLLEIYLPDYATSVQQAQSQRENLPPLPALKPVQSAVVRVGVEEQQGIRVRVAFRLNPQAGTPEYKATNGKILQQLPPETLALISGRGVKDIWQMLVTQAETDPPTREAVNRIRDQFKEWQLDADREVFGWMDGEFALSAIAPRQGFLPPLGFGVGLLLETGDRKVTESSLSKLDAVAKQNFLKVQTRKVDGVNLTEWRSPNGKTTVLGHGWMNGNTVFLGVGQPIVDMLAQKPTVSLTGSENFQAIAKTLPTPNAGYLYLNVDSTAFALTNNLLQAQGGRLRPEANAIANSIRSIGVTLTQPNATTGQLEAVIALKPNPKAASSSPPKN